MKRVCFVMNNIGDYHAGRLVECSKEFAGLGGKVFTVQASRKSAFYLHRPSRAKQLISRIDHVSLAREGGDWTVGQLWRAVSDFDPTHLFTIGYSDKLSLATLAWGKLKRRPVFFMADSKADDQPRSTWSTKLKTHVVRRFAGALVAGERHKDYFRSLGVKGPIELGYDTIDNAFFKAQAARFAPKVPLMRRLGLLPEKYVLCVSRLVDRKRLDLVLKIFADSGAPQLGYSLVLIGSGPNDDAVHAQIAETGLTRHVLHLREVKNTMMAPFYSQASALLLASDFDQWGLCVNEAMTLGVPCVVTDRCGVAGEIVLDGETGYVFPWGTTEKASADLRRLLSDPDLRSAMSDAARDLLDDWGLERYAGSVLTLVEAR